LDGEYIDSSEGYVTDELDFRRDHFACADTPLTFSLDSRRPAIFRGLIVFEYIRAIAEDVHAMNKLMMANSTPHNLCWLVPQLDVVRTETNWNPNGTWRPMSDRSSSNQYYTIPVKTGAIVQLTNDEQPGNACLSKEKNIIYYV